MILELTSKNFNDLILKSPKLCLIDFWADWCNPCKAIIPIIDNIFKKYNDKIVIGKINIDSNINLTEEYSIQSIPTIIFIKNSKIVHRDIGIVSELALSNVIDQYI